MELVIIFVTFVSVQLRWGFWNVSEMILTCLVRKNIFEIWLTPTTDSRKWWDEVHYARTVGFGI